MGELVLMRARKSAALDQRRKVLKKRRIELERELARQARVADSFALFVRQLANGYDNGMDLENVVRLRGESLTRLVELHRQTVSELEATTAGLLL
jgi:hypothetical protein